MFILRSGHWLEQRKYLADRLTETVTSGYRLNRKEEGWYRFDPEHIAWLVRYIEATLNQQLNI